MKRVTLFVAILLMFALVLTAVATAEQISGAVFTTNQNGSRVNQNIYLDKEDVYLDGGPGPNAPQGAAGLPDGDYYFQVTDPSGKVLLSQDKVKYRRFTVLGGIIVSADNHAIGADLDHNAVTVQLMPYKNTPNNGGVYKVWATPVGKFVGDPNKTSGTDGFHGFIPAWSKTDNFKVKGKVNPPTVKVRKFYDANANGVWDTDEPEITGLKVNVLDPLGVTNVIYTPSQIIASMGLWTFTEMIPVGNWVQTALIVDGVAKPVSPNYELNVTGDHEIIFGNVCWGTADFNTKGFWHNKNGLDILAVNPGWITEVNTLAPYSDNPFDGNDVSGNPVPAAKNVAGDTIAGEGTVLAEVSNYLVAPNTGGDPKIQLGQQLLAFIFNLRYNGVGSMIGPDGNWVSGQSLIDAGVTALVSGGSSANYWAGVFDGYNNNDAVKVLCADPLPIVY